MLASNLSSCIVLFVTDMLTGSLLVSVQEVQPETKQGLLAIWHAEAKVNAMKTFDLFIGYYEV